VTCLYPGDPPLAIDTVATVERDGFYLRYVRQGEHTGTHWGAPGHFNPGEPLADQLEPDDLCRPAAVVDVREKCDLDGDYQVTVGDLLNWEAAYGRIPDDAFVIIRTGWEARWGTAGYANADADGVLHQPGFSVEAVRWLIGTGRIGLRGGTGTDTFSPDPGADGSYAVSRLVYRRHRVSLEVLTNLGAMPPIGAWVLCGGQINKAGSGSPALIYGVLPAPPPG
jgi:kynurenine formamidase